MIKVLTNTSIFIKDGKISDVGEEVIIPKGHFAVPGFIDTHIHGSHGTDAMDGTFESLDNIVKTLAKEGVTSFLPTTMTQEIDNINKALNNIANYIEKHNNIGQPEILGIHLEGPFINCHHKGAQPEKYILKPTVESFKKFEEESRGNIRKVTYAPELDNNFEFTKYLCEKNIIPSVGHSSATFEEVENAVAFGLCSVTHFHNGQSPHHHRTPGVVTAGFTLDELNTEIIVDGIHLHPNTVKSVVKIKTPNKVTLITDAMEAKGLEDGNYQLGGQKVIKIKNEVRLESGSLAGSVNTMENSIKNVMLFSGCSLEDAVTMSSTNPAKDLGILSRKGSLDIGKDADIVILDNEYNVVKTICRGQVAFEK